MRSAKTDEAYVLPLHIGARFAPFATVFKKGAKGETILAGGLPATTGLVGGPNNFKTSIGIFLESQGLNAITASTDAWMEIYDAESTLTLERVANLSSGNQYLPEYTFYDERPLVQLTSNSTMYGDEWMTRFKSRAEEKVKDRKVIEFEFLKKKAPIPTLAFMDGFNKLESEKSVNMLLDAKKEGTDTNMFFMGAGLFKSKMLAMMPRLTGVTNTHILMTAHVGDKKTIASGPFTIPEKQLQHMRADKKLRGVPDDFIERLHIVYEAKNARKFVNPSTKLAEFPKKHDENIETDLNLVKIVIIRNKLGVSGSSFNLVVSQTEGVKEGLTDLVFLKDNGNYGIYGSTRSYWLGIYPDVKMSRTTVRDLIEEDPKLKRALALTADLAQYKMSRPDIINPIYMEPEELYNKIKELGYDWDVLLTTRGYWTPTQYSKKDIVPYLSIIDLLNIANGNYTPYFTKPKKES